MSSTRGGCIAKRQAAEKLAVGGVSATLIGETLMRSSDIARGIEELLGPIT